MLKKRIKTNKKPRAAEGKTKKSSFKKPGGAFTNIKDLDSDNDSIDGDSEEESFQQNVSKKWYEEFVINENGSSILGDAEITALRKEAGTIFEQEVANNSGKPPKSIPKSDYSWIKTVISKGTISDKIAAYVLLIQDNPVVHMGYLKTMVSMTKVGKKREFFMAMDTLVELFVDDLLPPGRKLKFFAQQPLSLIKKITSGDENSRKRLLLIWFYEDQLKYMYTAFLRAVNEAAHDSVDANKERAIVTMQKLLQGHPEQEATLLANIVNKLGDPSHKIGSKVIYSLTQLLDRHPAMKAVVANEVEKVIFRPNMSKRAQYYSVCFLAQFTFDSEDSALANHLITIYFSLFKACIKTGEIDSRMMKALLTGVSRAYPFAKSECSILSEHINTVYKVVHLSCANVAIHALSLLYLVAGDSLTDRFMTVLYKKIGETGMFNAAHHAMFLSIIFKAVKRDTSDSRVCAFIKRLLQVAVQLPVPLACGILILVSQVVHSRKKFSLRLELEAVPDVAIKVDDDDEDEYYRDQPTEESKPEIADVDNEVVIKKEPGTSSWYHAALKPSQNLPRIDAYDPYQRNPFHANGDKSVPAELLVLARHYHPTVALFASNILNGLKINYSGDPLQDFTLIRFLDKFVFKNPKKVTPAEERVTTFARFGRKKYYSSVGLKGVRVNTNDYLNHEEKSIPVDETFMYKYLKEKSQAKTEKIKEEKDEDDSDADSLDDDEFDDILSKVSKGGKDNLDYMSEIGSLPAEKQAKDDSENEDDLASEGEDGMGEDDEGDDDFNDLPDDDEENLSDLDSNAEDFDGDEVDDWSDDAELDSDIDETPPPTQGKKSSKPKKNSKSGGLFASAEEFSEILEKDQYQAGRSSALSNKDNAAAKQIKWEMNRDHWLKGGKNSKRFKKGPQGMKRKGNNKNSRPSKKIKK